MNRGSVFVSTGSFRGRPAEAVAALVDAGINRIELSGGTSHPGLRDEVQELGRQRAIQLHNYFPPADPPFVFNLASASDEIRGRTLSCMESAVELSAKVGASRYSVHAGFLVDPPIAYLGETWRTLEKSDLGDAESRFVQSVEVLKECADRFGIELLIENNVLTPGTRDECGDDVLLMASGRQIRDMMKRLPKDVGLLMDVAHLKVTSATLGLDPLAALEQVRSRTRGYHLSDNDGTRDTNGPVTENSWFWEGLDPNVSFATLEVSPRDGVSLRAQVELAESLWPSGGAS